MDGEITVYVWMNNPRQPSFQLLGAASERANALPAAASIRLSRSGAKRREHCHQRPLILRVPSMLDLQKATVPFETSSVGE